MADRIYHGEAEDAQGKVRVTVSEGGEERPLHHVRFHSEDFLWGFLGSGPSDLSLALLADALDEHPTKQQLATGETRSFELHQEFKRAFVARWPRTAPWTIRQSQILRWVETREGKP